MKKLNITNGYNFGGQIYKIGNTEQVSERFTKREVTVHQKSFNQVTGQEYNEYVSFELTNGNCSQLDDLGTGDYVNVSFNLRGNLWTAKKKGAVEQAITTLHAWRVEKAIPPQVALPTTEQTTEG